MRLVSHKCVRKASDWKLPLDRSRKPASPPGKITYPSYSERNAEQRRIRSLAKAFITGYLPDRLQLRSLRRALYSVHPALAHPAAAKKNSITDARLPWTPAVLLSIRVLCRSRRRRRPRRRSRRRPRSQSVSRALAPGARERRVVVLARVRAATEHGRARVDRAQRG